MLHHGFVICVPSLSFAESLFGFSRDFEIFFLSVCLNMIEPEPFLFGLLTLIKSPKYVTLQRFDTVLPRSLQYLYGKTSPLSFFKADILPPCILPSYWVHLPSERNFHIASPSSETNDFD